MGGLIAGQGGAVNNVIDASKNGSIRNISAQKIATIIAGRPAANAITVDNAVFALSGITSISTSPLVVGADVNGNGQFDFTNVGASGFQPPGTPDGDIAIDGLVIVRTAGYGGLPVTPLNLIEV